MLAKNFSDKAVFGWYNLKEYNRNNTDNSFEVILWTNNTYEFRYGALDIIQHDVLIGEQGSSSQLYTYYYHDECNTGTTNTSTCYNYDWNASDKNTNLENGGSLYSEGYIDCSDPLNDSSCDGYAAAYLTQQCDIDALYSTDCTGYEQALRDYECDQDPQFSPTCSGYIPEVLAVMVTQNGYDEPETYQITEDEIILYTESYEDFNEEEAFEEFNFDGLDDDEFYLDPIIDDIDPIVESISTVNSVDVIDVIDVFDAEELVDVFTTNDLLANTEELIQLFEFEIIIREELEQEQEQETQSEPVEVVEIIEEIEETIEIAENDEEVTEELEEETEELIAEETSSRGGITSTMLNVVRSTINAASSSLNNTSASNSANSVANNNASSSSGISTSNSPSMSEQITSSNAQNNMVLSLNTNEGGSQTQSVTTIITPLATLDSNPQVVMAEVQVQNMQGEIDTAVSGAMTQSEADQIAEQIIANNIKEQQEELQEESQESGEYADQSTLVAYLGYVPAFEVYKGYEMPKQDNWYTPKDIYADSVINDNNQAFNMLSTESYNTLSEMIQLQPNL
tara:strand:- start:711 stop:2414 length:1704 start_codon:yes stop_codon:yes gene_type:complete